MSDHSCPVTLIGHPFAPIGMGEHVRCSFRSLRSVGVTPGLIDIYGLNDPEPEARQEFGSHLVPKTGALNVFHINGDEVEQTLATLAYRAGPSDSYNIIYPAWELSRYPAVWARELDRFDEGMGTITIHRRFNRSRGGSTRHSHASGV